jgi:hypothetical protein
MNLFDYIKERTGAEADQVKSVKLEIYDLRFYGSRLSVRCSYVIKVCNESCWHLYLPWNY